MSNNYSVFNYNSAYTNHDHYHHESNLILSAYYFWHTIMSAAEWVMTFLIFITALHRLFPMRDLFKHLGITALVEVIFNA